MDDNNDWLVLTEKDIDLAPLVPVCPLCGFVYHSVSCALHPLWMTQLCAPIVPLSALITGSLC